MRAFISVFCGLSFRLCLSGAVLEEIIPPCKCVLASVSFCSLYFFGIGAVLAAVSEVLVVVFCSEVASSVI